MPEVFYSSNNEMTDLKDQIANLNIAIAKEQNQQEKQRLSKERNALVQQLKDGVVTETHSRLFHLQAETLPKTSGLNDAQISAADLRRVNAKDPFNFTSAPEEDFLKMPRPEKATVYAMSNHHTDRGYVIVDGKRVPVMNYNQTHSADVVSAPLSSDNENITLFGGQINENSYRNTEPFIGLNHKIRLSNGFYIDASLAAVLKQLGEDLTMGELARAYEQKFGKPYHFSGDPNRLVKEERHQFLVVPSVGGGWKHVEKIPGGKINYGVDVKYTPSFDVENRKTPDVTSANVGLTVDF